MVPAFVECWSNPSIGSMYTYVGTYIVVEGLHHDAQAQVFGS